MPIQILPARLANQIAAGEVVERPASVVKELIENSLDAGATKIDIDIEKGGHKRICIRDNGSGIIKDELALALSRHATSKISSLDDLEAICSLGFRGEALASISSVSRLTLTSRTAEQSEAWQAYCEGRDMQVTIKPAAHPVGTSIDVVDLFFNTPGRRKFLRTEKTEFGHIEEVLKRIALSRFDVTFNLKHNGKLLRKYPALRDETGRLRRVQTVCGNGFAEAALGVECQHDNMQLYGWIAQPGSERAQNDLQFCFVNGRMMRDKLINHAVRQAFEGLIPQDSYPAFVLYIEVPPAQVDVNVHPAKHEVRFHQARLVHDFIYRVLADALQRHVQDSIGDDDPDFAPTPISAPVNHDYIVPLTPERSVNLHSGGASSSVVQERVPPSSSNPGAAAKHYYALMESSQPATDLNLQPADWFLLDDSNILVKLNSGCFQLSMTTCLSSMLEQRVASSSTAQPLLLPVSIQVADMDSDTIASFEQQFTQQGFEVTCVAGHIVLKSVPAGLRSLPWSAILPTIVSGHTLFEKGVNHAIAKAWQTGNEAYKQEVLPWFERLDTDTIEDMCKQSGTKVVVQTVPLTHP